MNIALCCVVPSNIVRSVQIKKEMFSNDDVDLVIFKRKYVIWNDRVIDAIRKTNLFKDIKILEVYETTPFSRKDRIRILFWPKSQLRKLFNKKYDEVFSFYMGSFLNPLLYSWAKRKNPNVIYNFWEEGVGVKFFYAKQTYKRKILMKFAKVTDPVYENKEFVYWTSLYKYGDVRKEKNIIYKGTPRIDKTDKKFVELINNIFNFEISTELKDIPVIILEQECTDGREFLPMNGDLIFFQRVIDIFGDENVLVKLHPRSNAKRLQNLGGKKYLDRQIPFELFCLNVDMTNKLLITVSSTSINVPIFLCNDEPHIISLTNIVKYEEHFLQYAGVALNKYKECIEGIKEFYADQTKFVKIVDSEKELVDMLMEIKDSREGRLKQAGHS